MNAVGPNAVGPTLNVFLFTGHKPGVLEAASTAALSQHPQPHAVSIFIALEELSKSFLAAGGVSATSAPEHWVYEGTEMLLECWSGLLAPQCGYNMVSVQPPQQAVESAGRTAAVLVEAALADAAAGALEVGVVYGYGHGRCAGVRPSTPPQQLTCAARLVRMTAVLGREASVGGVAASPIAVSRQHVSSRNFMQGPIMTNYGFIMCAICCAGPCRMQMTMRTQVLVQCTRRSGWHELLCCCAPTLSSPSTSLLTYSPVNSRHWQQRQAQEQTPVSFWSSCIGWHAWLLMHLLTAMLARCRCRLKQC